MCLVFVGLRLRQMPTGRGKKLKRFSYILSPEFHCTATVTALLNRPSLSQFPDTAIHTAPGVVDASPTCRTTGTYPPGSTPVGICTLTCMSPATCPRSGDRREFRQDG